MIKKLVLATLFLVVLGHAEATTKSIEFLFGGAWSAAEDLRFKRQGLPDIVIYDAVMDTKPFVNPLYYGIRFAWAINEQGAWEFEHNHMKLYLDNTTLTGTNVQWFEITDGYNLFWLNKAWYTDGWILRLGGGAVIAHPQITVNNETNYIEGWGAIPAIWQSGYRWSGVTMQGSLQKQFMMGSHWFLSLEGKLVVAYAVIPLGKTVNGVSINDGTVVVPNKSIHANFGFGYKF